VAVSVALSPGHKTISLEVILSVCAFVITEMTKMNERNKYFFIILKDAQI
jgi:hypothetical protein